MLFFLDNGGVRTIKPGQVLVFLLLLVPTIVLGVGTTILLLSGLPLGDFRGITVVAAAVVVTYLYAFLVYRLFLHVMPLAEGYIEERTRDELAAHVHFLFYLVLFNSLIRTNLLPVPLLRLIYLALGARLGSNTYVVGVILDPPLTHIGANCIIGHDAVLFSHAIEGKRLSLAAIHIGNNVTIGAKAVIMSGVNIADGAIVSAGAVVSKGKRIAEGEIWGGVPARRLEEAAPGGPASH